MNIYIYNLLGNKMIKAHHQMNKIQQIIKKILE